MEQNSFHLKENDFVFVVTTSSIHVKLIKLGDHQAFGRTRIFNFGFLYEQLVKHYKGLINNNSPVFGKFFFLARKMTK